MKVLNYSVIINESTDKDKGYKPELNNDPLFFLIYFRKWGSNSSSWFIVCLLQRSSDPEKYSARY
jgi:hypothetical protein